MFKISCDLQLAPYEETTILHYTNCRSESFSAISLTSTSHPKDSAVSKAMAQKMSHSGLSPYNPNYREVYEKFTSGKANIADSKYILISEDNRYGVSNFPKSSTNQYQDFFKIKAGHNVAFVYESIFEGSNKLWGKLNYIHFTDGKPSLKPGILKEVTSGEFTESFYLDSYFIDYLLDDHPYFKQPSLSISYVYNNETELTNPLIDSYSAYLLYLRNAVIAEVKKSFTQFLNCEVNGESVVFIDASSDTHQTQDIKTMCSQLGGKIPNLVEAIQTVCRTIDKEKVSFGNEAFNINCDNFQTVLHDLVERPYTQHDEL